MHKTATDISQDRLDYTIQYYQGRGYRVVGLTYNTFNNTYTIVFFKEYHAGQTI